MRFERIRLSNFKCYADADLELDRGVTVIHGLNGSGKSSLLEACFFALYGSKALDRTLDDVVTIGAEDAEIELWFTHAESAYRIERRIRATGDRAQTAKCVLETPDGTVEGARDVRRYVADLLRMDADAFVNCAYVRQGEVNKLINATPATRQTMIDDLLQLGKLETYRERASEARLGVKSVLDDRRGSLSELESQIEEKEAKNLHERLNALETRLADTREAIEEVEGQRADAEAAREAAAEILASHEEKRAELEDLAEEIEELGETIAGTESERDELGEAITAARARIEELEARAGDLAGAVEADADDAADIEERLEAVDARDETLRDGQEEADRERQMFENQADNLREKAAERAERAERKRETASELEAAAESDAADLESREESLADIESEIKGARAELADAPVEEGGAESHLETLRSEREGVRERRSETKAKLAAARSKVEEAEELLEQGKCPECGQEVEDSPHVDTLVEDRDRVAELEADLAEIDGDIDGLDGRIERAREYVDAESRIERLEDKLEDGRQLLDEKRSGIEEKREQAATLREEAGDLENEAGDNREAADGLEEKAEVREATADEKREERESLAAERERLEELLGIHDGIEAERSEIERRREKRSHLAELNDQRRDRLSDKRERRSELDADFDASEVEKARTRKRKAEEYLAAKAEELEGHRGTRDNLQSAIGGVENEIEELENLRERRETLAERVDALESVYVEADELQTMYGDLRAELRQRNVESLERMLNEVFDLVYQNDSYSRIELDGEYELTVYQKDGEPLEPDQLSGGERALFNLSLRCAIYRLLSEGIEGAAPMPPLILDEPTVFLDSGHVSQLVELVESMRSLGVEQIVVVSHDDELVGAADDLVTVVKDSTTNRSRVERADAAAELLAD